MSKVVYNKGKKVGAYFYTIGKFGKGYRQAINTDSPYLYSSGIYPTKLTASDLPDDYIPIHSRVIWYMRGFLRTSGITDMRITFLRMITYIFLIMAKLKESMRPRVYLELSTILTMISAYVAMTLLI